MHYYVQIHFLLFKKDKQKLPQKKNTPGDSSTPQEAMLFIDSQVVHLPDSIDVYNWKRPSELFPDVSKSVDFYEISSVKKFFFQ